MLGRKGMPNTAAQRVVVTVNEQALTNIQSVVKALQDAGLQVSNVLATTGIVTGSIDTAKRPELNKVAGVAAVEADQEMRAI
jgi:hypothetical protein